MELLMTILGFILILSGLLGSFLPLLPGPPISYAGLLLLHFYGNTPFSNIILIVFAALVIALVFLDYLLPIWTTKKFGGSKAGQWGATLGVLLGLFAGPWGIVLGPLFGAYLGELVAGSNNTNAWQSAKGAFLGFLLGTGLKIILIGSMLLVAFQHI
ncbi:MAG: DUF456 domain-containing protein [Sphingomonadales bacterium]|nr:DUF456 domain-containing protein [Sphingomonadales bacterium]